MDTIGPHSTVAEVLHMLQYLHQAHPSIKKIQWHANLVNGEDLVAVLSSPHGHKIRTLKWSIYRPPTHVLAPVPFLGELEVLTVAFRAEHSSNADFISSVLERPNKLTEVSLSVFSGDATRFFGALERSRVTSLEVDLCVCPTGFFVGLKAFLRQDRLDRFSLIVSTCSNRVEYRAMEIDQILASCAHIKGLKCDHRIPSVIPKSVTDLELANLNLGARTPLKIPGVRNLTLVHSGGLEVEVPDLETLKVIFNYPRTFSLPADISRVRSLDIHGSNFAEATINKIGDAIMGGHLRELRVSLADISDIMGPALKHPNCALVKLDVQRPMFGEFPASLQKFRVRVGMFALLLARKRPNGRLKRLPVEMFRLVGQML